MTYIYETLDTIQITNRLLDDAYGGWSYNGAYALAHYLESLTEDCEPIELDVVALRCEFTEYATIEEVLEQYNDIKDLEDLQDHTTVIEFDGGLIIGEF